MPNITSLSSISWLLVLPLLDIKVILDLLCKHHIFISRLEIFPGMESL